MLKPLREKRLLYISLVHSQVFYCSVIWRPHLLKDIILLENVQRRTTKYILNDYRSDYKSRLIALGLLPLMYIFELNDILFCIKNLKSPCDFSTHTKGPSKKTQHPIASAYHVRIMRPEGQV